jgi:head-tail adaptor
VIAPRPAIADRPHYCTFQAEGTPVPDGDGGYTTGWGDLDPPQMFMRIDPATAADLERLSAGTVISTATHIIRGPFHPGVTTKSRVVCNGHTYNVRGFANRELRDIDMVLLCEELVE